MTKGKSLRGSHLLVTRRASTIILISIITTKAIITLILWSLWRWRRRCSETAHDSLLSCDTTNTSVHLTQLITENVKASIHTHKVYHDGLESHSTRRRRRSGGGWSRRSRRSRHLSPWPLRSKLGLIPLNGCCVYSIHDREVWRLRIGDRCMAKDSCDSRRKNELITGHRILIDVFFRNLKPLAKLEQGVFWRSPQDEGVSQKRDESSSLDTVLRRSQLGLSGCATLETHSTLDIRFGATTMRVPRTRVIKRGKE